MTPNDTALAEVGAEYKSEQTRKIKELVRRVYSATKEPAVGAADANVVPLTRLDDHESIRYRQAVRSQLESNTALKELYARRFIWVLIGQLIVMNVVFFTVGLHQLSYDSFTLRLYMGGTLTEVFGVVYIITRYLFPTVKGHDDRQLPPQG